MLTASYIHTSEGWRIRDQFGLRLFLDRPDLAYNSQSRARKAAKYLLELKNKAFSRPPQRKLAA
jgi:hypothetical protein